jgi:hypothetical protein
MECSFGNFTTNRFVLAPLTRLRVDYVCADSMQISWQKMPMARAYRIYTQSDSAYSREYADVSDTLLVIRRTSTTPVVYSVKPLLSNGLEATRSYAVNLLTQGVSCYYQALVAETMDNRIKLSLALSYLSGIDSLVFCRTTESGVLRKRLQSLLPDNSLTGYEVYDNEPISGVNYYRVLIYTSGGIAYSEIAAVLHNGRQLVRAYPNPVRRGQPLYLLVKESAATGVLQIFDATGKLMGTFPFNSSTGIHTTTFKPGLYFYKLTHLNGRKEEAGKIVVL